MQNKKLKQLCVLLLWFFYPHFGHTEICTPIQKTVKYRVSHGDHLASILRNLKLEPIFCKNCSLAQLLKSNHIQNQNQIQPGQLLDISFRCEEDLKSFLIVDQDDHRLVTFPRQVAAFENRNNESSSNVENEKKLRTEIYLAPKRPNYIGTGFVVPAELKNVQIQNGENDWSKIDCKGLLIDGLCVNKLDSYYVKVKNKYLTYDFEDDVRHESYNLSSQLSPGFEIGFIKQFTKQWSLFASVDIVYENVTSTRYAVDASKYNFMTGLVDARYRISENSYGLGLLAAEENYFVPTGAKIDTKSISLLYLKFLFAHTWLSEADQSLSTEASLSISEPKAGTISLKASQIFALKNEFVMKHDESYYTVGAEVVRHEQNTNLTHQSDLEGLLAVGMGWFF